MATVIKVMASPLFRRLLRSRCLLPHPPPSRLAPRVPPHLDLPAPPSNSFSSLSRAPPHNKPVFFDMIHSNNGARVRLWLRVKRCDAIDHRFLQYPDLQSTAFVAVNPLKKVPALIRADGATVFESNVILNYLQDKFGEEFPHPSFVPSTAEGRQVMDLMCRIHDLYIASPNCTAPGFSHSQGAMYLSKAWHGAARGMDARTRAAKIAELWKQLCWLEENCGGKYLVPCTPHTTLADLTWFPTCVFMEYMLPRVFGWPQIFEPSAHTPFPKLASWYSGLKQEACFAQVHSEIWDYWVEMDRKGQFAPISDEILANPTLKFRYGSPQTVTLNYQSEPAEGKQTGRYINQPDRGDVVDQHEARSVLMRDARELYPPPNLESMGFQLASCPTGCTDFSDSAAVVATYYNEMIELVKRSSGAARVLIFDHTIRESGLSNLNASVGSSASPVPRVHCDYTAGSAPRRMAQLGEEGIFSRLRGRNLSKEETSALMAGRFAFINVWRSISDEGPVMQSPLAVCDETSVPERDRFIYELRFPDRTGENYSLRHSRAHRWFYYPWMRKDECLIFKVYDKKADGPRFVFHTAFDDPQTPAAAPPRKSIEVRAIAFFDVPWAAESERGS